MRILGWNILNGGEGRADPLAQVILAQEPDILALVEADNREVLAHLVHRTGMDFIHARGGKSGAALLSRWPIRDTIDHAALRPAWTGKSLLEATVQVPGGGEWPIGIIHLTARAREEDERIRQAEIGIVIDLFAEHRRHGRPHLLIGDFNSNAPYQQIDPARCKKATREAWHLNGGQIPRRVVQAILDAGYLDSLRVADPPQSETAASFSTRHPGQRVDYLFTFGLQPSMIKRAWIVQDGLAASASDHFPIGAVIG